MIHIRDHWNIIVVFCSLFFFAIRSREFKQAQRKKQKQNFKSFWLEWRFLFWISQRLYFDYLPLSFFVPLPLISQITIISFARQSWSIHSISTPSLIFISFAFIFFALINTKKKHWTSFFFFFFSPPDTVKQMASFIEQEAKEKADEIRQKADEDFSIESLRKIEEEKARWTSFLSCLLFPPLFAIILH